MYKGLTVTVYTIDNMIDITLTRQDFVDLVNVRSPFVSLLISCQRPGMQSHKRGFHNRLAASCTRVLTLPA